MLADHLTLILSRPIYLTDKIAENNRSQENEFL